MREIQAIVDVTSHSGQWHTMEVRLPFSTPKNRVAEFAIAKAKAEMGSSSRWCIFRFFRWKTVINDDLQRIL